MAMARGQRRAEVSRAQNPEQTIPGMICSPVHLIPCSYVSCAHTEKLGSLSPCAEKSEWGDVTPIGASEAST